MLNQPTEAEWHLKKPMVVFVNRMISNTDTDI